MEIVDRPPAVISCFLGKALTEQGNPSCHCDRNDQGWREGSERYSQQHQGPLDDLPTSQDILIMFCGQSRSHLIENHQGALVELNKTKFI